MTTLIPPDFDELDRHGVVWCAYTNHTDFKIQFERAPETEPGSGEPDLDEIEVVNVVAGTRRHLIDPFVTQDGATRFWRARHVREGWLDGDPTPFYPARAVDIPDDDEWPSCGDFLEKCPNLMGPDAAEPYRLEPVENGGIVNEYDRVNLRARGIEGGDTVAFGMSGRIIVEGGSCIVTNADQTMCRTREGLIAEDFFDRSAIGSDWEILAGEWTMPAGGGYLETPTKPGAMIRYVGGAAQTEMVTQAELWMDEGGGHSTGDDDTAPHPMVAAKVMDDHRSYIFGMSHGSFSSIRNEMLYRSGPGSGESLCATAGSPWDSEAWGTYRIHAADGAQSGTGSSSGGDLGCSATDDRLDGEAGYPGFNTISFDGSSPEAVARFRRFRAYRSNAVKIENVPSGWSARMVRAAGDWVGEDIDQSTVTENESDGEIELTATYYPFTTIELYDDTGGGGTKRAEMSPSDGIWGGDIYHYAGDGELPGVESSIDGELTVVALFKDADGDTLEVEGSTGLNTREFSWVETWANVPTGTTFVDVFTSVGSPGDIVIGAEVKCVQLNRGTVPCECTDPEEFRAEIIYAVESITVNACSGGGGLDLTVDWDVEDWVTDDLYQIEVQYRESLDDGTSRMMAVTSGLDPQAKTHSTTIAGEGSGTGSDEDHDLFAVVILYEKGSGTSQSLDSRTTRITTVSYGACT